MLAAVLHAQTAFGLNNIDPRYFVGTCFHESGCTNEFDTEVATATCPPGFQSVGAFQIGAEEATHFSFTLADMLDLTKATLCMVRLAESNRNQLRLAAKLSPTHPDPDYIDEEDTHWTGGTMRAYLAIAHNHGIGYSRATIAKYGMDWSAYKKRNPTDNIVSHHYGEDCITGGPHWPKAVPVSPPGHRVLRFTRPYTTGEDVMELQRHLGVTPDGVFGPHTEDSLIMYQRKNGLVADGICTDLTWQRLLSIG